MTDARGIHAHASLKTGLRPNNPTEERLALADFVTTIPDHPLVVEDGANVVWGLDDNDKFGFCVPTAFDNFSRMITRLLQGEQKNYPQHQIVDWYRSQNPDFDPATGAGDGGMNIQQFLSLLVKQGVILGFAEVDVTNRDLVRTANYLFLGLIIGADLTTAQQTQTVAGVFEYKAAPSWGGHCMMQPGYTEYDDEAVTWADVVRMTPSFMTMQRKEAWVVLHPLIVQHPRFRAYFNTDKFAAAYTRITHRAFPVLLDPHLIPIDDEAPTGLSNVAPAPTTSTTFIPSQTTKDAAISATEHLATIPASAPPKTEPRSAASTADLAFAPHAKQWLRKHHIGLNDLFSEELRHWIESKGLS